MTTTMSGRPLAGPVDTPPAGSPGKVRRWGWLIYLLLIFFSLVYLYPFLIQIGTSFKTNPEATANPLNPFHRNGPLTPTGPCGRPTSRCGS